MNDYSLPIELRYLFQNQYLDSVKLLIILNQFQRRKKGIVLDELNYYFTMLNLVESNDDKFVVNRKYLQDNYLSNESKIKRQSVVLGNQEYIDISMEKTSKKSILYFSITDKGKNILDMLKDEYFNILTEQFWYIYGIHRYSVTNQRKVLKRDEK
ncbi:MAG: hypothetical protein VB095_08580 [Anaerovorax sp.]|nr:hypothetical protein [Anaerovorax sp.]